MKLLTNTTKLILTGCLCLATTGFSHAQGLLDEQGMEVPRNLQLQQDKDAVKSAFDGWWSESMVNYNDRMQWYNDAKFGCFIHWGVYSVPAGVWDGKLLGGYTEHLMRKARIPLERYRSDLVGLFNPTGFDAEEWMQHAHEAGMKYFVITAKHHDGFAMYHSDAYPYDMRLTGFDRDPLAELRDAARKYDIRFGFYYSHAFDWEHPDAPGNDWDYDGHPGGDLLHGGKDWWIERGDFIPSAERYVTEKSIPQIQELILKYDPDILWFDTPHKLPLYLNVRILEAIREVDKENKIVVNGRLARFSDRNLGDYYNTGDRAHYFYPQAGYWESIPTTNESYGYSVVDTVRKSSTHFIQLLTTAASKGGNILMNVGPMGNGKWDEKDVEVFRAVGKWLQVNGEAVYGTERTDLPIQPWGVLTKKGDVLYAHVYEWPINGKITIGGLRSQIAHGWIVSDPSKSGISFTRLNDNDIELSLPSNAFDSDNTVIALKLESQQLSYPVRLLDADGDNVLLTFDSELMGKGLGYGDGKPNRNYVTKWRKNDQWMRWHVRLNEPATFAVYLDYNTQGVNDSGTVIVEVDGYCFELDYENYPERNGTNTMHAGTVNLSAGEFIITLRGKTYKGEQYMTPLSLRLIKK